MIISELFPRGLAKLFGKTTQIEKDTIDIVDNNLPVCPVYEGDDLTDGSDTVIPQELEPEKVMFVKIVGSRNPITGEIASYHKEVHGTTYPIKPLTPNQETTIQIF